jgi:hypothetical protein
MFVGRWSRPDGCFSKVLAANPNLLSVSAWPSDNNTPRFALWFSFTHLLVVPTHHLSCSVGILCSCSVVTHLRGAPLHHLSYYFQTLFRHLPPRTLSLCNSITMSQEGQLRNRKGKSVSFEEPVSTPAGPSSASSVPAAWPSSIQAAPLPSAQAALVPSVHVTPPLSIYRPASRDYPGPPSAIQAAFAAAPKPRSFLELIRQTDEIVGANARNAHGAQSTQLSNAGSLSNPVGPSTGQVSAPAPSSTKAPTFHALVPAAVWPSDIYTPPLAPAFPAYRSSAAIASSQVTQPVGPALPPVSSASAVSSGRSIPHLGSGLFNPSSAAPGPSDRPTQHLGTGLSASSSTAAFSPLRLDQHVGSTLPASNSAAAISSGGPTQHLGSGLHTPSDAAAASPLRLAQLFGSAARPYQPTPYDERGTYGPQPELGNQPGRFGGHSSNQTNTYEQRETYGPQLMQYVQPAAAQPYQPSPYDGRQTYSPSPEQLAEDSGSAASSANQPSPYDLRETYEPEPEGRAAALARLQHAEQQHALSLLRLQIRRQQLQNQEQSERLQQEEERQWRLLEARENRHSRRR